MAVLVEARGRSTERHFQGEAVYQIELSPHYNSGRSLLLLLDLEVAIVEGEVCSVLVK